MAPRTMQRFPRRHEKHAGADHAKEDPDTDARTRTQTYNINLIRYSYV